MIIKLLDRDETYLRNVEAWDVKRRQVINGDHTLEFSTLDMSIEEGHRVIYREPVTNRWREYIVTDIDDLHDGNGVGKLVYAEDSFYETIGDWIDDRRLNNTTATAALMAALDTTRWEVGQVDNLGLASTNYYRENPKEAIQKKLLKAWGGEFDTRIEVTGNKITHRYVDLKAQLGANLGKRFVYDKDMVEVKRTVTMTDFCTALYGFGKGEEIRDDQGETTGGYGRRIDFASVNDGKAYVENAVARDKYGYVKNGARQHIFAKVEFDEITDPALLKAETQKELIRRSTPSVTYSCKVIDLRKYGMEFEGVGLGDTALVVDNDLGIRVHARVMEYIDYPDNEQENEITLGNFRKTITSDTSAIAEQINNFRSRAGVWDRADIISENGIPASYIDGIVEELNERANASGGWVFMEPGGGLISYNAATPQQATEAVQIIGGTVRIANQKNADGTWRWRTFFTGSQVVADLIRTGVIQGGKVRFNLDDGTFLIGNSTTDYQLYWNGSQLRINGSLLVNEINLSGGVIKGKNITLDGDTTVLGTFSVPTSIITGNLSANRIQGGEINAQTINVSNLNASNLNRGTVGTSISNTSGSMMSGYKSANMSGSATGFNANSGTFNFNYDNNAFEVQGRINAFPSGNNHALELNGLYLSNSNGSASFKVWSGYNQIDGSQPLRINSQLQVESTLRLRGKDLSLGADGFVKWS